MRYMHDPANYADDLSVDPWTVTVSGRAKKTGKFAFEDITKGLIPEERVYRFRCVEAWSMVVPWMGIPLKKYMGDPPLVVISMRIPPQELPCGMVTG